MAEATWAEIQAEMVYLANDLEWTATTPETESLAKSFGVSARCAKRSFKALQIIGTRYSVRFQELGNYEAANLIERTVAEAY